MSSKFKSGMYASVIKPAFDRIFSLIALILLSPVLILIILLLLITNRGKVFFFQSRPGKNSRIFQIIKFKTMNDRKDKAGNLLDDKYRLTQVGRFIRKASIDEIPQLINVLKGDMSLIGPRPLLVEYLDVYNDHQKRRHEVKPGITGWAQVNGRNAISWEEKFDLDVWYVNNISFTLDCRILLRTIKKVFKKENINSDSLTTMERFMGN